MEQIGSFTFFLTNYRLFEKELPCVSAGCVCSQDVHRPDYAKSVSHGVD